ncbi:MAG: hypothetical protein K0Q70_2487, partial [Rhodospirillales bacterium]|nr:hypothetical protein [Rhodospirillales bacterium]
MRNTVPAVRLAIGLAQGLGLYLLYKAIELKTWPATDGLVFAPMVLVVMLVPLVAIVGWGNLHRRTLALWVATATLVLVGLAIHDLLRGTDSTFWDGPFGRSDTRHPLPSG